MYRTLVNPYMCRNLAKNPGGKGRKPGSESSTGKSGSETIHLKGTQVKEQSFYENPDEHLLKILNVPKQ